MPRIIHSNRRQRAAILLLLACSTHAATLTQWRHRQPLTVERGGVVSATLPPETLDAAKPDLADLRVLDPAGREVPFLAVRPRRSAVVPVRAGDFRTTLTNSATQILIAGDRDVPLELVTLETPAGGFIKSARVETSADGTEWRTDAADVPIFRQAGAERLTLRCGTGPFVRITIDDSRSAPVPFTGARFVPQAAALPAAQPLAARVSRREEFAGETVLTIDLGAAHVTLAAITFTTPEPLFTRTVRVTTRELRDEAAIERTLATGTIFRVAFEGATQVSTLEVPLEFDAPARELLVHVDNGDSPPIELTGVALTAWPARIAFNASVPGSFALLSGNPQAVAPRYDVAALAAELGRATLPAVNVGPLTTNPDYRRPETLADTPLLGAAIDPKPWRYRKGVRLAAPGVQQLELDLDVLAHAQPGFADLRLVRDGAQVPYLLERPALSRPIELALRPADDPKRPQISRWQITLPREGLPLTRLALTSTTPLFQRHLRLFEQITDKRGNSYERTLATLDWSRTPGDSRPAVLTLAHRPATGTLLLETHNGDNPPIALGAATGAHAVTRLLFKTESAPVVAGRESGTTRATGASAPSFGRPVELYYGNAQVAAPRYDLALVASQILSAEKGVATLEPEEKAQADGWAATALAGARGGWLFWGMLALVVIVLLVVVAKLLPKPPPASR